jgi:hypothetical protein
VGVWVLRPPGLFDPISSQPLAALTPEAVIGSNATKALNLKAALQSLVLLHNGATPAAADVGGSGARVLPLKPGKKIAVLGPHAMAQRSLIQTDTIAVCDVNGNFDCLTTPFEAISQLNKGGETVTARGCDSVNASTAGFAEALALARTADTIVFAGGIRSCGGTQPGEADGHPAAPDPDYSKCHSYHTTYVNGDQHLEAEAHDRRSIDLPWAQHALLAELFKLKKPVVLVLLNGGAVAIEEEMKAAKAGLPMAVVEVSLPTPTAYLPVNVTRDTLSTWCAVVARRRFTRGRVAQRRSRLAFSAWRTALAACHTPSMIKSGSIGRR